MQSMTGYGRSEVHDEHVQLTVEARSVNHRYLDIMIRYPRLYTPLEARMKQLVGSHFARGRIEITIVQQTLDDVGQRLDVLDQGRARQYYETLQQLQATLRLPGTIDLGLLLTQRDILRIEDAQMDAEAGWKLLAQGLHAALLTLGQMRAQEGGFLGQDLRQRVASIVVYVDAIRQRLPDVVTTYRQRLEERIADLFEHHELDPERLYHEVVLFAERTDVTEELTRLEAHLQAMTQLLEAPGPIGRKSDFLLQEMNREVNTIASKSNDAKISQDVVEIKSELERMREQIQNVE
jgi:uncharacterized protein (TIGR00255 family)